MLTESYEQNLFYILTDFMTEEDFILWRANIWEIIRPFPKY